MARRKDSGLDLVAAMPWPAGVFVGILAFLAVRYGVGRYFDRYGGPFLQGFAAQANKGMFTPLAVMLMLACWMAAAVSYVRRKTRKRLLDTQTGLDSIAAMNWREFEMLVGEAFRRQGYSVEETGLGGADGGIDLVLRKDGRTELVQCRQWRNRQIKPSVVREMWGLVAHHRASGVKIVCTGEFTREAEAFADGKAIDLVNGERLFSMIRSVRAMEQSTDRVEPIFSSEPLGCPKCGASMVRRTNRHSNEQFWGCSAYPRCKATRPAQIDQT